MDEGLSGTNNLIMIGRLLGIPRSAAKARARELLERFDEADQLAHDIVVIDHGQVVATGTPDELKATAGGQVLQVSPADPARMAEVAALLEAGTNAEVITNAETGVATAPVTEAALVPRLFREFDDRGIELAEFALRKASLDEVFFALTGHRADNG